MAKEIYDVRVGVLDYGVVAMERDGWRFYPNTCAREPSRIGHPTSKHAIPGWVPRPYTLVPRTKKADQRGTGPMTHTPGPWQFIVDPQGKYGITGHDHKFLAITDTKANARLIASAPDLLEALKLARECIAYCRRAHPDPQKGSGFPVEMIIDAALAKAEGKQP